MQLGWLTNLTKLADDNLALTRLFWDVCEIKFMLKSSPNASQFLTQSSDSGEKTIILPSPLIECNANLSDDVVNGDKEREWFERWDYSHLAHSDVDLHY